ncbi:MAG TPA: ATP-dependent sacrificial sulfur transferase LarE [Candidatus Methanoperedens sp.]|nr:ATP-dependent sacrificial sulfur transferase LarE [Candidatus Methanoperedens sp.]
MRKRGADAKLARLEDALAATGGCLVAYSGGVDSTFLLAVARRALGDRAVAATVRTLFHERGEAAQARRRAGELGARHQTIALDLEAHPEVLANPPDRCYLCKRLVFTALRRRADELGLPVLADATQADDLSERRPGLRALRELGVASPLAAAGLGKDEIRVLSARLGIAGADRPSSPCLATRVPFGETITPARLRRVSRAEHALHALGFADLRVRDYGDLARIELQPGDMQRAAAPSLRRRIVAQLRGLGYRYVTLDLAGYRSGSMDEAAPEMRHE